MRKFLAMASLVSLGLLPACGFVQRSFKSAAPPVVTIESARAMPASDADAARVVYVDIIAENPNPDDLPILSITYDATISNGASTFRTTATRTGQATISRFGAQRIALPIAVPVEQLANPASFTIQGQLEYLRPSAIAQTLNENGAGGSRLAFQGAGVIAAQ